ncbi:MAG: hypothetical protein WCG14_04905 [Chlamydiia bacterium]
MINLTSSRLLSDQAGFSRESQISGEGLRRSSMGASAQAESIISLAAVEEDESNCSCLTVMTEKVCALWTACYETVSPSITAFCNWVSNLFTGANQEAGQEAVGRIDDESALQRVYSAISIQIEKLVAFVRSNCVGATVEPALQQDSTRGASEPASVEAENVDVILERAEEPSALALLERPAGVEGPTVAREDGEG